jgi:hypothetical protein
MNPNPAYDSEGYELIAGDYVTCNKKLYRISKLSEDTNVQGLACKVLELLHVKSLTIVKRKDFEVERLN